MPHNLIVFYRPDSSMHHQHRELSNTWNDSKPGGLLLVKFKLGLNVLDGLKRSL